MAVAVKSPTPVGTARPLNRLPIVSLLGVAYVVGCLGIIFSLIPLGWRELVAGLHGNPDSYAAGFGLGLVMLGATIGLCVLGGRLLGTDQPDGARAGILLGFVGFFLALLATRWGSLWTEYFADNNFFGSASETVGIVLTLVIAALCIAAVVLYLFNFDVEQFAGTPKSSQDKTLKQRILVGCMSAAVAGLVGWLFVRYGPGFEAPFQKLFYQFLSVTVMLVAGLVALVIYLSPTAHSQMVTIEGQGWLTAKGYKPLQGVRVRRATIIGILLMVAAGIYSMLNHNLLPAHEWKLNVPFTGKVTVENPGDLGEELKAKFPNHQEGTPLVMERRTLQEINAKADTTKYRKLELNQPYGKDLKAGKLVAVEEYKSDIERLKKEYDTVGDMPDEEIIPYEMNPTTHKPEILPASGPDSYRSLTLLPNVKYTVGLLLLPLIAIWLAWRVINLPAFADFLIATEAEMNKVSWTTKKRLYQDTVVVLITVLLMAFFLFTVDLIWSQLLSWKQIGVIVHKPDDAAAKPTEVKPW